MYVLYCTNTPQIIELLLKLKKKKQFYIEYIIVVVVDQITHMETCNTTEWNI